MRAYSADLRDRVLSDCDGGLGTRAVAAKYRVSASWARRLKQVRREAGRTTPADQQRGPTPEWVTHADAIRAAVAADPDATLAEYRQRFALPLSRSALARALVALGLSRKKVGPGQRAGPPGRDGEAGRVDGGPAVARPGKLVFVDETWASTNIARTHGRCRRGKRLMMDVPHGHWKTTFVAALRADGMTVPVVIDGAVIGDLFVADVEQQRVPALRSGDVVVMDNLACHKRAGVRRAIEAAGGELRLLPAHSPNLNPIEKAFRKLKVRLRAAAQRTVRAVEDYLGELSTTSAPEECRNYFSSCGYSAATPTREPF